MQESIENLEKIANYLDEELIYIMFGVYGQNEKAHPHNESELDSKLIDMLIDLTPSELLQAVAFVEGLKANRKA